MKCSRSLQERDRGTGTGVTDSNDPPCGCCVSSPGLRKEELILLTADQSPQLPIKVKAEIICMIHMLPIACSLFMIHIFGKSRCI